MSHSLKTLAIAVLLYSGAALAQPARPAAAQLADEGFFQAGSQYTASFDQTHNRWRMQPVAGQDVVIDTGTCSTGAMIPAGVWLLVLDDQGRAGLVAPSVTPLPAGSPDHIALRACDRAQGGEIAVPQTVIDLLTTNTGAIYVYN
jgi:hypothetical protein